MSQNALRVHFGLGGSRLADEIVVKWPSGAVDRLRDVSADRIVTVEEGGSMK
jgi:hypothetical protein